MADIKLENIKRNILKGLEKQKGKVGFYYKDLITGENFGFNDEQLFESASVIKFPILLELYRRNVMGEVDLSKKIKISFDDMLPSCGAINSFTYEPEVEIRTIANWMITLSDNSAANILIKLLGLKKYREGFDTMGLKRTSLERLLFDEVASKKGIENKFVISEIAMMLEKIYTKNFLSKSISTDIEKILLNQQINYKIPGDLLETIPVAHKTGDDDGISNDVGIVYWRRPFIICFASNDTNVIEFNQFIRKTTYALSIGRE